MHDQEDHIDPTSEISLDTVKERAVKGVVALTGRYFVLYLITLIAQGFLGAFLTAVQFGVFGIVSAIVNFLVYFSDIGLAASLIQKKEKISDNDLKTTFTVQQILVISLLVIIFLNSGKIQSFYHLDSSAILLLYALGGSFLMSSLKTIPSVLLERNLRFEILAISNILESIVYNFVLVMLAWRGFGITSFTIAVLARGVTGLVTLYIFQPWVPRFGISRSSLSKLLKFGIPYQINTFIAVIKDDGLTLVLGKIMGLDALGILVWAQKWIQIPLRVVLDNVSRVTFPAFSRMQDEGENLRRSVTRSIFFITFLTFPAVTGIVVVFPVIMESVARYHQWLPAALPIALLSINVLFASVSTQLTNVLNATGRIKITSALMVMWTILTWGLVPYLALHYGINGASLGYALVGISSIAVIIIVKKFIDFSLTESTVKPFLATIVMAATLLVLRHFLPVNLVSVVILIATGAASYIAAILVLVGASLVDDAKKAFGSILSQKRT